MTITEGLADIKTITARLIKKQEFVGQYAVRNEKLVDPLLKGGGSVAAIAAEMQAIGDLEQRIVVIRTGIHLVNLKTPLTVHGKTLSIMEWLTWRKEVAPARVKFLGNLRRGIDTFRTKNVMKDGAVEQSITVNLDEAALAAEQENIAHILGDLDGQLSLLNATTTIEV